VRWKPLLVWICCSVSETHLKVSPTGAPLRRDVLTDKEIQQYHDDGFLVMEDFFTDDDLRPVLNEIESTVDALAKRLYKSAKVSSEYADLDVWHRLTALDKEFPGAAVLIHTEGLMGPALQKLFSHPRLLNLVSCLIGPDIAGHPVWNVRSKTPGMKFARCVQLMLRKCVGKCTLASRYRIFG